MSAKLSPFAHFRPVSRTGVAGGKRRAKHRTDPARRSARSTSATGGNMAKSKGSKKTGKKKKGSKRRGSRRGFVRTGVPRAGLAGTIPAVLAGGAGFIGADWIRNQIPVQFVRVGWGVPLATFGIGAGLSFALRKLGMGAHARNVMIGAGIKAGVDAFLLLRAKTAQPAIAPAPTGARGLADLVSAGGYTYALPAATEAFDAAAFGMQGFVNARSPYDN